MRRRYFFFLLILLTATVAISSAIQIFFFSNERRQLVDQQIEATASALIASGFSSELLDNLDEVDDLLKDILGEVRVDQIINIFNSDGQVLYRNIAGNQLPIAFVNNQRWMDMTVNDHDIRLLVIKSQQFYIQVGLVLDASNRRWFSSNQRMLSLILFMFLSLLILSYYLSKTLFRPIQKMAQEFGFLTTQIRGNIGHSNYVFEIPEGLKKYSDSAANSDEIHQLAAEIGRFLVALNDFSKNVQSQSAILTHELKTPLTVLYSTLERLEKEMSFQASSQASQHASLQLPRELSADAKKQVQELADTVNGFLRWAVFSSRTGQDPEIYAVKIHEIVEQVKKDLETIYGDRIRLDRQEEFSVFCHRDHLRQLIRNLVENSLRYSETKQPVKILLAKNKLTVMDFGPGIPAEVVQHLGTPFNRGPNQKAHSNGLGLAWVHSICRRYGWILNISTRADGATVEVVFENSHK